MPGTQHVNCVKVITKCTINPAISSRAATDTLNIPTWHWNGRSSQNAKEVRDNLFAPQQTATTMTTMMTRCTVGLIEKKTVKKHGTSSKILITYCTEILIFFFFIWISSLNRVLAKVPAFLLLQLALTAWIVHIRVSQKWVIDNYHLDIVELRTQQLG